MIAGRCGPFVQPLAVLSRRRLLPVPGDVLLEAGDRVDADTVVARAAGQGVMHTINAARQLDLPADAVPGAMLVAMGDRVGPGQPLARTRGLWGLGAATCAAPAAGTVVAVSAHTGRILLEEDAPAMEVPAFLPGVVTEVHPGRGVTVCGRGARVAGVFGLGRERGGVLRVVAGRADAVLGAEQIGPDMAGAVLLGGGMVTGEALRRAAACGVAGVITGGVHDRDLAAWLGRDLMLADTTAVDAPLTMVVTGGFGRVPQDPDGYDLLRRHAGRFVVISGRTRVRAGALRPEVIVPLSAGDGESADAADPGPAPRLGPGARVVVVRSPWFGHRGTVGRLHPEPGRLESGARCLVADIDLDGGPTVTVAQANLEVLSS